MFELVISVIATLALVGICMALVCIASSLIQSVRITKYWAVMNHLGLRNQLVLLEDPTDDDVCDKIVDTINISRKYIKEIAPEEFED